MKQFPRAFLILSILIFAACSSDTNTGQRTIIIDDAKILTDKASLLESYREYNEQLFNDYQIDFRVITTESNEDINAFTNKTFELFEQKNNSPSGRAMLLVINTRQNLARLEVSMALEPIYTDIFISFIERQHMVHFFRDNRMAIGIFATTERMYTRATEAALGKEFMADMATKSIGGGAKISANIGRGELNLKSELNVTAYPEDSPQDILEKYILSRRDHIDNPNLDIFTEASRAFFSNWTVTPVQMDNEAQAFASCSNSQTVIADDSSHAVIIFPIIQRNCSPYLLKKEQGSWKLDFATMTRIIRFNINNKWHLILGWKANMGDQKHALLTQQGLLPADVQPVLAPYLFAFDQYLYDVNGYPFEH